MLRELYDYNANTSVSNFCRYSSDNGWRVLCGRALLASRNATQRNASDATRCRAEREEAKALAALLQHDN